MSEPEGRSSVRIGPDVVRRVGDRFVIDSPAEMPDLEVRRYRRFLILFEDRGYFVSERTTSTGGRIVYALEPWPDDVQDPPVKRIVYDETFVADREAQRAAREKEKILSPFVLPLVPLVGFLPSSWKAALHERVGIDARAATSLSLWIEYFVVGGTAAVIAIFSVAGGISGRHEFFSIYWLLIVLVIVAPDVILRYHSVHDESISPPGFYEWIVWKRRR